MSVIASPTPGAHFSNGLSTQAEINLCNSNYPIATNTRWQWNLTGAESTANAGSNLQLQAIADDGTTIVATSLSIARSTGVVTLLNGSSVVTSFADGSVSAPSVNATSNTGSGLYFTTNAVNVAANGVRGLIVNTATTGVNYLSVTPSATAVNPSIIATGSDTNVGLIVGVKGTGLISLGGMTAATSSLQVPTAASQVNFLSVAGSITAAPVTVTATGTDTNVGLNVIGKGTGAVTIGGASATVFGLQVATVASQAEGLVITGAVSGANASISAQTNNLLLGAPGAIATTATTGWVMINTCAGTPTGVPVGHAIGNAAMVLDTSGNKLWFYDNGTWKGVAIS